MRRAVALLLLAATPAAAEPDPSLTGAKAFVAGIYRDLGLETFDWHKVAYSPRLAELIRRDEAYSDRVGGEGALDAIPFCACQDIAEDYRVVSTMPARTPQGARVTVVLQNDGPQRFVVDLVWMKGWRVADVTGPESGSLLDYLAHAVPAEEADEKKN